MSMISPLLMLLVALCLAYALSEIFKKAGLPRVTGQICAGLVLGIGVIKSAISSTENLQFLSMLANLGIILLFYYVGMQISFKTFSKNLKHSITLSIFNAGLPLFVGFLVAYYYFNLSKLASLIIGLVLAASSQAASFDLLEELKLVKTKLGKLIITTGAVDDVFGLVLVAVILSFFQVALKGQTLVVLLLEISAFLAFILFGRLWLVPASLKYFDKEKSSTARFMASIIILFLIAALSEFLGLGALVGAMVAGMIVRQTIFDTKEIPNWEERDIAKSLHIISFGFLIPLFFVWVGFNADLSLAFENVFFITVLILITTLSRVTGTVLATLLNKGSFAEGILSGFILNTKGDIELAIAALALNAAIITNSIFTSIVVVCLLSTIVSTALFKYFYLSYLKRNLIKL